MSDQQYTFDLAKPEDLQDIASFINSNFILDVPLIRMFGIKQVPSILERNDKPDEHTAFIVKATSVEGNIIGVAVNRSKDEEWPITEDTDEKTVQFVEFIHFIDKEARLSTLPERTVELYILSVAPNWRRKGIAKRLGECSIRVAKQKGFEMMKICCANEFTANVSRSLGFQEFYKLAYSDYSRVSGKHVKMLSLPPHNHMYYYVKDLKE